MRFVTTVCLMLFLTGNAAALEVSAGADTVNTSQASINAKIEAGNSILTAIISKITSCGAVQKIYDPKTDGCVMAKSDGGDLAVTTVMASGSGYRWPTAVAKCPSDTKLVGGGAYCVRPGGANSSLMDSEPKGNGWSAFCMINEHMSGSIKVYALCAKMQ